MQSPIKPASRSTGSQSEYAIECKTRALRLETADALRADARRISYASINSNASKWRYSSISVKT
jgi:hypothetical protein